jgi:hypothetical protein
MTDVWNERGAQGGARDLPRTALWISCSVHALVFAAAALALAWRAGPVTALFALLAALHLATAVAAGARHRLLGTLWKTVSMASLAVLALVTLAVAGTALYVTALYRGLGALVAGALLVVWCALALFTAPIGIWGLAGTLRRPMLGRSSRGALLAALALAAPTLGWLPFRAQGSVLAPHRQTEVRAMLERLAARPSTDAASASVLVQNAARCAQPVHLQLTLLVAHLDHEQRARQACLQASDVKELERKVDRLLNEAASSGSPLKLDLITGWAGLSHSNLLAALSVKPGEEGVCAELHCLAPWQLVAADAFTRYAPFSALREARFGVSLPHLRKLLGASSSTRLERIRTRSYLLKDQRLIAFDRVGLADSTLTPESARRASKLAEAHVLAAQRRDGKFRYLLDPMTGRTDDGSLSLARQAGTAHALCEVGESQRRRAGVRAVLDQLATYERRSGEASALSDNKRRARLNSNALPLVAMLACRPLAGDRHDALAGRLARLLLGMQRADGSFHPELDLESGKARGEHEALYGAGQAVLALIMLERLQREHTNPAWPSADEVGAAVDRAMTHYAGPYWGIALREFFFLEENWHCIAAREALASHRRDDYEQFCLDYVSFKARLVQDQSAGELAGGYGPGEPFPPHNTATAGFAEALAAAIAVAKARKLDTSSQEALLRRVLAYLVRAQWTEDGCFACSREHRVAGGFSEHFASPVIRIDYVQHAMAALGHGRRSLGWD